MKTIVTEDNQLGKDYPSRSSKFALDDVLPVDPGLPVPLNVPNPLLLVAGAPQRPLCAFSFAISAREAVDAGVAGLDALPSGFFTAVDAADAQIEPKASPVAFFVGPDVAGVDFPETGAVLDVKIELAGVGCKGGEPTKVEWGCIGRDDDELAFGILEFSP